MKTAARVALASFLGAAALSVPAAAEPLGKVAQALELSDASSQAFSQIAGCVSTGNALLVSIVVDESASLRTTDPQAYRVNAITAAIDALQELRASSKRALSVQASLGTFARRFTVLEGWRELTPNNAEKLRRRVAEDLPQRKNGNATDYRVALEGARSQLDARALATAGDASCKVMLWFTDGALDVDNETDAAAQQICRNHGLADGMREDGIAVLALALFARGGQATPEQRDQLRAVAEGSSDTGTCGSVPISSSASSGAYLSANDAAALGRLFGGAGALISGASPGGTIVCPGVGCRGSRFAIEADPGVGGFQAFAQMPGKLRQAKLIGPKSAITIPATDGVKTFKTSDGTVQVTRRPGLMTVSAAFDRISSEPRRWVLDLGGQTGIVDLYWNWGAELTVPAPRIVAGKDALVRGTLTHSGQKPLPQGVYRELDLLVQVGDEAVTASLDPDGSFVATVRTVGEPIVSAVPVSVTARAVTLKSGTRLGPLTSSRLVEVVPPASFPSIRPSKLDLGRVEGVASVDANLHAVGTAKTDSTVCFADSSIETIGSARIQSAPVGASCVTVRGARTKDLRIKLTPSRAVDGIATGEINLVLTSKSNGQRIDLAVPVRFDLVRPVSEVKRWTLVSALVLGALLFPLLILLLSDLVFMRFVISTTHQLLAVPVRVNSSGIHRRDGKAELVQPDDLRNVALSRRLRTRRFEIPNNGGTLSAEGLHRVLRGSRAVVRPLDGQLVISGTRPIGQDGCRSAPAHFGPVNTWHVLTSTHREPTQPDIDGVLVAVTTGLKSRDLTEIVQGAPWDQIYEILIENLQETTSGASGVDSAAAPLVGDSAPDFIDSESPGSRESSHQTISRRDDNRSDPPPAPLPDIDFL